MLEELLNFHGVQNLNEIDVEDIVDYLRAFKNTCFNISIQDFIFLFSNTYHENSPSDTIGTLYELGDIVCNLVGRDAYEDLLDLVDMDINFKKEFAKKYPKDAYLNAWKREDDELGDLAYKEFMQKHTEEDLLEVYNFLLENEAYTGVEMFTKDFYEEIFGSDYKGYFYMSMFECKDKFLSYYLAREMLDSLTQNSEDYDPYIIMAEIYDLAEMGENSEVIEELDDILKNTIKEGLQKAWDEVDPNKKEIIKTVYDLASKIESYYGVQIPQKMNVIIGEPTGMYGSIQLGEGNGYGAKVGAKTRAAA